MAAWALWVLLVPVAAELMFVLLVPGAEFGFASCYSDHMVLQKEPAGAVVWGYGEPGAMVTVALSEDSGFIISKKTVQVKGPSGTWTTVLDPMDPGGPYTLTAMEASRNVTLQDIYFGDVWLCSGQSNMAMTVLQIVNSSQELAAAAHYPHVRLFTAAPARSDQELEDLEQIDLPWSIPTAAWKWLSPPTPLLCCCFFLPICSCFLNRKSGPWEFLLLLGCLLAVWAVPARGPRLPRGAGGGGLGRHPHRGLVLPQGSAGLWAAGGGREPGEENTHLHTDQYNCTFPALIADWRWAFHTGSTGQNQLLLPFGFVQLSTYRRQSPDDSFARLRWHQTADLGVVPNARMPSTFMAVAMDLGDEHSPYGSIHPRDKQTVAHRLHLGARAVAYREKNLVFQGPYPTRAILDMTRDLLNITYSQELVWRHRDMLAFEVCCSSGWLPAPVVTVEFHQVTLALAGCGTLVLGLRYAWAEWPCDYQSCALYNAWGLPAPPFLLDTSPSTGGTELLLCPSSRL
ncbi:sialate O-acetylesterase isoform X3 [Apus apus]|uniref:sialate O-acetylesterase isoform X3 n=1 Tax=Apus apus TaxID=8895 RepID=UPI0021F8DD24|nr:sialate O-acetylesterase isoform X3 [Apus apus]